MIALSREIENSPAYLGAVSIVTRLRERGREAYLVGGVPRDILLGNLPTDYDVATNAPPDEIKALFERTLAVGEQFGVILVLLNTGPYEVATFRADDVYIDGRRPTRVHFSSAREDALRRDFTVNALFFDPVQKEIIDFVGGQEDIQRRRIRTVGDPELRFTEDHLRLIRAVRFAARLNFKIDRGTFLAILRLAPLVNKVAAERLGAEMTKMLAGPRAGLALRLLSKTGLLVHFLPEIAALVGCEQPPNFHPEGDVFTHTCLMLDRVENPSPSLALALLLHDVAKPPTLVRAPDRIRFDGHTELGALMAGRILRRLKMPRSIIDRVQYLVGNHLRLKDAPNMRPARLKRFFREEGFPELLELFRLDSLASHGDLALYDWCRQTLQNLPPEELKPTPLIGGRDLIALGYKPGPIFKIILTAVENAQLEGAVATTDDARRYVRREFPLKDDVKSA